MDHKSKILQEYQQKMLLYQEYSLVVKNLLEQFLNNSNIRFQLISNRAKNIEKLSEKIDRKLAEGKEYKKLEDIEDLAGVRIVFYLEDDKECFLRAFSNNFSNSIFKTETKYNPRGYKGIHIIFKLSPNRVRLPEYEKYRGLKCEIQVTSILYHAWSEVEHDIIYKPEGDPKLLKTLGLEELHDSFEEIMIKHIQAATIQLSNIYNRYKDIQQAGKILTSNFIADISSSGSNDEIYEKLEVIEKFYYKKPEETLSVIDNILKQKPIKPKIIYRFKDKDLYGKSHKDIVLKAIELLSEIRYYNPDYILDMLSKLSLSKDKDVKQRALNIVEKFSKYDFNILTKTKIGYSPQDIALNFIKAWSIKEKIKYFDFVEVVAKELLGSCIEGTTTDLNEDDCYTITMHSCAVQPTDFLKKLRFETIDLLYELYKSTGDTAKHIRIIAILEEAIGIPANVVCGNDLDQMIKENAEYLADIYRKIVFNKGKLTDELAVAKKIEEKIYWLDRTERIKSEKMEKLRLDILKNKSYKFFSTLLGDIDTYYREEDWSEEEQRRNEEINILVKSINLKNLNKFITQLNLLALQSEYVGQWHLEPFWRFLRELARNKPQIAEMILTDAIDQKKPLTKFATPILQGFRDKNNFNSWDKFLYLITRSESKLLTESLISSLNLNSEKDIHKDIRDRDIIILTSVIKTDGDFAYLRNIKDDFNLRYALISTLMRNYKRNPAQAEELLIDEMKRNINYTSLYLDEISLAIRRKWFDIEDLSVKGENYLEKMMVGLPNLDWHIQEVLHEIGLRNFSGMINVFYERITKDASRKERSRQIDERQYEAIPYHLNPKLRQLIAEHPDYPKYVERWFANLTEEWSLYNWHISHFIQRVGSRFNEIIQILIDRGDDESLMKAARLMNSVDEVDFDLSIEIVRRTVKRKVIEQVGANMCSTGVVSGEDGLANAFKAKAKDLERYLNDKDRRVSGFAKRMIRIFNERVIQEQESRDRDRQLRRIEFKK